MSCASIRKSERKLSLSAGNTCNCRDCVKKSCLHNRQGDGERWLCDRLNASSSNVCAPQAIGKSSDQIPKVAATGATVRSQPALGCEKPHTGIAILPSFDLPGTIRQVREQQMLSIERLADLVSYTVDDVQAVEAGEGRAAVLARVMDTLKVDLTGLKPAAQLCRRLQLTREARSWTIDKLAQRSGLSCSALIDLENAEGTVPDLLVVLSALSRNIRVRSRHALHSMSDKDSRFTPAPIVRAVEDSFGEITFDPCSHAISPLQAVHQINKATGGNGLNCTWFGSVVFVNPPYSRSSDWLRKVNREWHRSQIGILLCLVNSKTDAAAFHEALQLGAAVFFFQGRVKYIKPDGSSEPSSQPSMLLAFGTTPEQRRAFAAATVGTWMIGPE